MVCSDFFGDTRLRRNVCLNTGMVFNQNLIEISAEKFNRNQGRALRRKLKSGVCGGSKAGAGGVSRGDSQEIVAGGGRPRRRQSSGVG